MSPQPVVGGGKQAHVQAGSSREVGGHRRERPAPTQLASADEMQAEVPVADPEPVLSSP